MSDREAESNEVADTGPAKQGQRFEKLRAGKALLFRPKDRFGKFSIRARQTMRFAQEEALRFDHNYIGTEHLLLGLLRVEDSVAAKALHNLGIELGPARASIEALIGRGEQTVKGEIGLTPRAKQVLQLADDEARSLNHGFVGTEHLLLGLVREGKGVAVGVMHELGAGVEMVRAETLRVLEARPPQGEGGPKNNVITCRLDDHDLEAIDDLIEAGIRTTRSDAAAWLIHAGIEVNAPLFETLHGTIAEIRRLRGVAQQLAQQAVAGIEPPQPANSDAEATDGDESDDSDN
jgi:hypothetical protein